MCIDNDNGLVSKAPDVALNVAKSAHRVDDTDLVLALDHIDGLVVHEVAVAFPGMLVDLAENAARA